MPALTVSVGGRWIPFPEDGEIEVEALQRFCTNILKGDHVDGESGAVAEISNPGLVERVIKQIGELVTADTFKEEVMAEGADAALLLFSSSTTAPFQE